MPSIVRTQARTNQQISCLSQIQGLYHFDERVPYLLIHGICHLLGHTHDADDCHATMVAEEDRLLRALNQARLSRPASAFRLWAKPRLWQQRRSRTCVPASQS
mmetsp:Transcript_90179/g.156137  ORF Transcript_90179/g.156137 Transcript_90179/m.156137 type:complete len:103 (-) Transcript_90179:415-723(-)